MHVGRLLRQPLYASEDKLQEVSLRGTVSGAGAIAILQGPLLTYVIGAKFCDQLPSYRQSQSLHEKASNWRIRFLLAILAELPRCLSRSQRSCVAMCSTWISCMVMTYAAGSRTQNG